MTSIKNINKMMKHKHYMRMHHTQVYSYGLRNIVQQSRWTESLKNRVELRSKTVQNGDLSIVTDIHICVNYLWKEYRPVIQLHQIEKTGVHFHHNPWMSDVSALSVTFSRSKFSVLHRLPLIVEPHCCNLVRGLVEESYLRFGSSIKRLQCLTDIHCCSLCGEQVKLSFWRDIK